MEIFFIYNKHLLFSFFVLSHDYTPSFICDLKKIHTWIMFSFFLYLTLTKINALKLKTSLSEGGFSSCDHCFAAFQTGAIDLINRNFRSEPPKGKQIWAAATYCFSQAVSFKQVILNSNPPMPADRWRENAALWSALGRRRRAAARGTAPRAGRAVLRQQSAVQKAACWARAAPRHPRPGIAAVRCTELLANPPGRRKIATDGNCQQGTNSRNRGIHDRNYGEKEKKAIPMYSFHLFS